MAAPARSGLTSRIGTIVAVDSLSVRAGLKLRLEGTPARRMDWRPGPALPSVCVELDYHPVVRLRARVGAPHARAESAVQLVLPCAWNCTTTAPWWVEQPVWPRCGSVRVSVPHTPHARAESAVQLILPCAWN